MKQHISEKISTAKIEMDIVKNMRFKEHKTIKELKVFIKKNLRYIDIDDSGNFGYSFIRDLGEV